MKLLVNENLPLPVVEALREVGHDVLWARDSFPGLSDELILQKAHDEKRLIVTFDKDFGELAFRRGLPSGCGIILFRIRMSSPQYMRRRVVELLAERNDWNGHLFIVEEHRMRIRALR